MKSKLIIPQKKKKKILKNKKQNLKQIRFVRNIVNSDSRIKNTTTLCNSPQKDHQNDKEEKQKNLIMYGSRKIKRESQWQKNEESDEELPQISRK